MNINDFIKDLSIKDRKTLAGKFTKLIEETGELARVILPFESAHGTNHRFVDREDILEELVDIHLCNISILYSMGFSEEDFDEMLVKKSRKWSELQAKEEKAEFPLPFEIHITVNPNYQSNAMGVSVFKLENGEKVFDIDRFKSVCERIRVKPIIIDLEINNSDSIKDVMTSSKHFGDNRTAYEESMRISNELKKSGYFVSRNKIETVPWHPGAPVITTGKEIDNNCYFESHIGVVIDPDQKSKLSNFVNYINSDDGVELNGIARLSRNFFKKSKDGDKFVNMLTYRCNKIGRPTFILEVDTIKEMLRVEGFEFEKVDVEYAIYDTNVSHDAKWILGE